MDKKNCTDHNPYIEQCLFIRNAKVLYTTVMSDVIISLRYKPTSNCTVAMKKSFYSFTAIISLESTNEIMSSNWSLLSM